jgi:hypothetical protein
MSKKRPGYFLYMRTFDDEKKTKSLIKIIKRNGYPLRIILTQIFYESLESFVKDMKIK